MSLAGRIARLDRLIDTITDATERAMDRGDTSRVEVLDRRYVVAEDLILDLLEEFDTPEPERTLVIEATREPSKHADGVGFTPFAWKHLLHDTGFAKDHEVRPYIFGGSKPKRVRVETRTSLTLAFNFYTGREDVTHMWVQYSDGKRHLVHRKAGVGHG